MKNKVDIKLKNGLRTEQKVIRFLIAISVISLVLSAVVELFSKPDCPTHWDYIKNILLGISGSSIISFVCVILPHRRNVLAQISNIEEKLIDIYGFYLKYHLYFKRISNGDNVSDDFTTDVEIYKSVDIISKKIKDINKEYNNSDYYCDNISNIVNMLNDNMQGWLYIIKNFYESLLNEIIKKGDTEILFEIKKDYQYLIKEKDFFTILLDSLDKILPKSNIVEAFSKIGISPASATINDFNNSSMELINAMNTYNTTKKNSETLFLMNSAMISTLRKWSTINSEQYKKFNNEFNKIQNNEKFDLNKHYDLVSEINNNLGDLDFEKAKENIELLRKIVEEDNK